ncbi:MAG TPA: type II secretion system F family protein [Acidimicrobiia bacterium]|jgi:tight adherence protein B|nr:type II secretion system F family protein [Acidimicrobiia bacterium]
MHAGALGAVIAVAESVSGLTRALGILAAIATAVGVFMLLNLILGSQAVERDLESRLSPYTGDRPDDTWLGNVRVLRRFAVRAERLAERRGVLGQIETALEQANIAIRAGEAIVLALGIAAFVGLAVLLITGNLISAVAFGLIAVAAAAASVAAVAASQRRRFEDQLPDTLNLLATSLRAGYSMQQALEAVSQEAPQPTGREFQRVLNEIRLGRSVRDALADSAQRMESVDFDWVVLAFTIQREVGGNLAEVLQTTSETILQRGRLRREMRALTAEGRISALVLGALPFGLFLFLFASNREYLEPMLDSRLGVIAVIIAIALLMAGIVWLTRIIKIEV